jgi:hypothetical protein
MSRRSILAASLLLSCGSRSPLSADQATPLDAAVNLPAPGTSSPAEAGQDATASSDGADASGVDGADTTAEAEAGPARPCHLVPAGDAVQSIATGYVFKEEGMLLRRSGPPHVIQYGAFPGAGTDGWGDPALYAAEYDVSVWPPREVHPPTRFADAEEGGGNLIELPGNELLFAWTLQVDSGGIGPADLLFQKADATSWQLGAQGTLIKHATSPSPPSLTATDDGLLLAYTEVTGIVGGGYYTSLAGAVASFALDGSAVDDAATTWSVTAGSLPAQYLARTETDTLDVVGFDDCTAGLSSTYCVPHTIVVLRVVVPTDGGPIVLQRVAAVPLQNADNAVMTPVLLSDRNGHNWLTWWEGPVPDSGLAYPQDLYAIPLTNGGIPSGPVESWFASDRIGSLSPGAWAPLATVGTLGSIYPVPTYFDDDAGTPQRRVHLIHRQLDAAAPVEDVTFDTASTAYAAVAVEIAEPRSVIVGYSTYPAGAIGCGELARYTCAEDAD